MSQKKSRSTATLHAPSANATSPSLRASVCGAVVVLAALVAAVAVVAVVQQQPISSSGGRSIRHDTAALLRPAKRMPCDVATRLWNQGQYKAAVDLFETLVDGSGGSGGDDVDDVHCAGLEVAMRHASDKYYASFNKDDADVEENKNLIEFHRLSQQRPIPAAAWLSLLAAAREVKMMRICLLLNGMFENSAASKETALTSLSPVLLPIVQQCVEVSQAPFSPSSKLIDAAVTLVVSRLQEFIPVTIPNAEASCKVTNGNVSLLQALTRTDSIMSSECTKQGGGKEKEEKGKAIIKWFLLESVAAIHLISFAARLPLHSGPYAPEVEWALTGARRILLELIATSTPPSASSSFFFSPAVEEFAIDLAEISFDNEYVYSVTAEELSAVELLEQELGVGLAEVGGGLTRENMLRLIVLACFKPLYKAPRVSDLLADILQFSVAASVGDGEGEDVLRAATQRLLYEQIELPAVEAELREGIVAEAEEEAARRDVLGKNGKEGEEGGVTAAVAAMYEDSPYPRWRNVVNCIRGTRVCSYLSSTPGYKEQLSRLAAAARPLLLLKEKKPSSSSSSLRVLFAGSGTGRQFLQMAETERNATFVAVDLSASSLAYAKRQAMKKKDNGSRLTFLQRNLLHLERSQPDQQEQQLFDVIEVTGVLHHMEDPEAGLRALTRLLAPGGAIKIALYSRAAREYCGVYAARARILRAQQQEEEEVEGRVASDSSKRTTTTTLRSAPEDIRKGRELVLSSLLQDKDGTTSSDDVDDDGKKILRLINGDFHSLSDTRDLLFHVHEVAYSLPEIGAMLERSMLRLIGFDLDAAAQAAYRRYHGRKLQEAMKGSTTFGISTDNEDEEGVVTAAATAAGDSTSGDRLLRVWDEIEQQEPGVFAGMYQFWAVKKV